MIWHLIHDSERGTIRRPDASVPEIILCGSLLCEADLAVMVPGTPLLFISDPSRGAALTLTVLDDGRLHLMHRRGVQRLGLSVAVTAERVRITYSWDMMARSSLLSCECLDSGLLRQSAGGVPPCLTLADWSGLADAPGRSATIFRGHWIAAGEGRHLPGHAASMTGQALIATPRGEIALGHLRPGDGILTLDAGEKPLLWTGRARVPALGSFRPVRLLAPFFGDAVDLVVQPHQRIVVAGSDIEYLVGEREVLIEARHLVNGATAVWDDSSPTVVWHGMLLEGHHLVLANGCPTETLHLGRLAESRAVAATTAFAQMATTGRLPVHTSLAMRTASGYEAVAITSALARRSAPVSA